MGSVFAGPVELVDGKYLRFFDYTDEDGNIHKVDLIEPADTEFLNEILRNPDGNQYFLFTRSRILRIINNLFTYYTNARYRPPEMILKRRGNWERKQSVLCFLSTTI